MELETNKTFTKKIARKKNKNKKNKNQIKNIIFSKLGLKNKIKNK
jgi:hypothetical protein